jgi:hypothetical protein
MRSIAIVVVTAIMAMPAAANELPVRLKQGPGLDKVESNCGACHSLDYIPMNSPFLNAVGWDAEVTKMINAFGAPIDQANAKAIADYLAENYGTVRHQQPLAERNSGDRSSGLAPIADDLHPRNVVEGKEDWRGSLGHSAARFPSRLIKRNVRNSGIPPSDRPQSKARYGWPVIHVGVARRPPAVSIFALLMGSGRSRCLQAYGQSPSLHHFRKRAEKSGCLPQAALPGFNGRMTLSDSRQRRRLGESLRPLPPPMMGPEPHFRRAVPTTPAIGAAARVAASPLMQSSPSGRRVGVRIVTYEAFSISSAIPRPSRAVSACPTSWWYGESVGCVTAANSPKSLDRTKAAELRDAHLSKWAVRIRHGGVGDGRGQYRSSRSDRTELILRTFAHSITSPARSRNASITSPARPISGSASHHQNRARAQEAEQRRTKRIRA